MQTYISIIKKTYSNTYFFVAKSVKSTLIFKCLFHSTFDIYECDWFIKSANSRQIMFYCSVLQIENKINLILSFLHYHTAFFEGREMHLNTTHGKDDFIYRYVLSRAFIIPTDSIHFSTKQWFPSSPVWPACKLTTMSFSW